jgi:hypothetical protein
MSPIIGGLLSAIPEAIKGVFGLIDDLHTSDEEKLTLKQQMFALQAQLMSHAMDFEARQIEARAKIVEAEAKSEGFLTRSWRPIVMLTFCGLVVARWFGLSANIPLEIEQQLWMLLQIGIGGYVAGRSAEKVAEVVGAAMRSKQE